MNLLVICSGRNPIPTPIPRRTTPTTTGRYAVVDINASATPRSDYDYKHAFVAPPQPVGRDRPHRALIGANANGAARRVGARCGSAVAAYRADRRQVAAETERLRRRNQVENVTAFSM